MALPQPKLKAKFQIDSLVLPSPTLHGAALHQSPNTLTFSKPAQISTHVTFLKTIILTKEEGV